MADQTSQVKVTVRRSIQTNITESFKSIKKDCIKDPDNAEIICGQAFPELKEFCQKELKRDHIYDIKDLTAMQVIASSDFCGVKRQLTLSLGGFKSMSHDVLFDVLENRFKKQSVKFKKVFTTIEIGLNSF